MKKLLSLILVLALVFAMTPAALAADEGNTVINYSVTPTYAITIPTGPITVSDTAVTGNVVVTSGGKILSTQTLTVTATSANPGADPNKAFRMKNAQDQYLEYSVKIGNEEATALKSGDTVLTAAAADVNAGKTATLSFKLTGTPVYAGVYADTITFTSTLTPAS